MNIILGIIHKRHGSSAEIEAMVKLWCDNQVNVKNYPVDQNTMCYQAKLIFPIDLCYSKLKQDSLTYFKCTTNNTKMYYYF